MTVFKRDHDRYLVVKLDKLADDQGDGMSRKEAIYREAHFGKALVECVVIESDWPIYDQVWDMVQRLAEAEANLCRDEGCPQHGTDHVCNPPDKHPNCEIECGAYGTYCKCNDEASRNG